MKAMVLLGGRLEVGETPDPVPGSGELLVKTLSTAICASDVHFMDHPETVAANSRFAYDQSQGVVMGHEFIGEVIGHGPDCSDRFPVGTRVTSMPILLRGGKRHIIGQHPDAPGGFGELMMLSEELTRAVPDRVPNDAVAVVDAFAVGEFYVRHSRIAPGEVPLVVGAGAIGLSAVAALRVARGIEPILVADFQPARLETAKTFGAHVVVNPAERSPYDVWTKVTTARSITAPAVIFECVGAAGLLQAIIDACPSGSRIFAAGGWYTGDTIRCSDATMKGVSVQFGGGPHAVDWYGTLDAVCEGRLDPLPSIGMIVGLDELPAAIDLTRQAKGPARIVVHPNG